MQEVQLAHLVPGTIYDIEVVSNCSKVVSKNRTTITTRECLNCPGKQTKKKPFPLSLSILFCLQSRVSLPTFSHVSSRPPTIKLNSAKKNRTTTVSYPRPELSPHLLKLMLRKRDDVIDVLYNCAVPGLSLIHI